MANSGFPKASRLLTADDYQAVFANNHYKVSCRHFLILALRNSEASSRLGLVVAKKNIASAAQRNRLKRLIRESFRHRKQETNNLDLIVLVRKDADKLDNHEVSDKLGMLWQDLNKKCTTSPA